MARESEGLIVVVWWCFMCSLCLGYQPSHSDQCFDLYEFRKSITYDEHSSKLASWDPDRDCCSWNGVSCNTNRGNVIGLNLSSSGLYGQINSSNTLFGLVHLQTLHLDNNNFFASENNLSSCQLPDSIGNLKSMKTLNLQNCSLSGPIPSTLANLTLLVFLDLSYNNFTGHVPLSFEHFYELEYLDLSYNKFTGPIPPLKSPSSTINDINLSNNQFTGPIPSSYVSGLPNLHSLQLHYNSISGEIPSSLFTLPSLKILLLFENKLCGELKELLGPSFSSSLHVIDLSKNELQGSIPSSLFKIPSLETLYMGSNNFSGIVDPQSFENLKSLFHLDLSYNIGLDIKTSVSTSQVPSLRFFGFSYCNLSEFPEFLRNQVQLSWLDLSNNRLQGKIPKWLWTLSLSILDLSHNLLYDFETPLTNFSSSNLQSLQLQYNSIQAPLPSLPASLSLLSVSNNKLIGEIHESICNFSGTIAILAIDLSNNQMTGTMPSCLANLSSKLSILDVHGNKFYGEMPQNFDKYCKLEILNLSSNQLEGSVPKSLANCTHLKVIDIGNNHIKDTFPYWLENIPELQVLILRSNRFHGPFKDPVVSMPFPKLHIIDLSNNQFTGNLPSKYFQHWNVMTTANGTGYKLELDQLNSWYFQYYVVLVANKGQTMSYSTTIALINVVDMSNNRFEGEIPQSIGGLKSLMVLNLSQNNLMSEIPSVMGNLIALQSLDLSENQLFGQIPSELTDLTFLEFLNLSMNLLAGRIPTGGQFNTFTASSFEGNAGLCDHPLPSCCIRGTPPMQRNFQGKFLYDIGWISTLLGYASGVVVGVVIEHYIIW